MPFLRKYGTLLVTGSTSIRIPLIKRAVVDFALGADWVPAAGDVKVFVDGAAVANITNLPTAIASGNGAFWEFILTAAELTCKQLLVVVSDAATKAVEDQAFIVETYGNASAMYVTDLSAQLATPTNITAATGIVLSGVTHTGAVIPTVTTLTGHTAQTGDSFARIGLAGAGLTNIDLPNQTMDIVGNITGNLSGSVGSVTGAVGSVTGAVGSVTGLTASNLDAAISTRATPAQILTTALTEAYAADGVAPTLAQALFLIQQTVGEFAIAGTTLTAKKLDGIATAATYTLDDSVNPTSRTRAT